MFQVRGERFQTFSEAALVGHVNHIHPVKLPPLEVIGVFVNKEIRKTTLSTRFQSERNLEWELSKVRRGCCHSVYHGCQSTTGVGLG